MNLILNPAFDFHVFDNHRLGLAPRHTAGYAAFWNTDAWNDIRVIRAAHLDSFDFSDPATAEKMRAVRAGTAARNLVAIKPGKIIRQFLTLPEANLAHGDRISLQVYGYQSEPNALRASIRLMKLDSEDGTWQPKDFIGAGKDIAYQRHSRGELIAAKEYEQHAGQTGAMILKIEDAEIIGHFSEGKESRSKDINTIGIEIVFANTGTNSDAWIAEPSLSRSAKAQGNLPPARAMIPYYRHLPRTIQKLWKGEPIHIIVMGSSIDRASANPSCFFYDENPQSPTFKQPLSYGKFDSARIGRPDLADYIGEWRHYWSWSGRLRLELMRKFNLPASRILLNFMACDGSCAAESHSALEDYCALRIPPGENANGHPTGKTWLELYPDLFARPEGPRPDLVLFGSGANEKVDTPDEVAVFEGIIRWMQRHYPNTEFLFSMFQNRGGYTPNVGDLQALALRYQIPMLDCGQTLDEITRWCNRYTLVPIDGHPQAAAHYIWFKQAEKAFECWDPIQPGQAQLQLPERLHPNAYGWEGDIATYQAPHPRINQGKRMILDDTVINLWANNGTNKVEVWLNGAQQTAHRGRSMTRRDTRNSTFAHGRLPLGNRHIVEVSGANAAIAAADCKICPQRAWFGAETPLWRHNNLQVTHFESDWGAPFGTNIIRITPGQTLELDVIATDISAAYADQPDGGTLVVRVNGQERLRQPANQYYQDAAGNKLYLENRKGILNLGYGIHTLQFEALDAPVQVLGVFTYDARANRQNERRTTGWAAPGQTLDFPAPFKQRPVVLCHGNLEAHPKDISAERVLFSGKSPGLYEIIGE